MSLTDGLETMKKKADAALLLYTKTSALKLQNSMRSNAPWKDRTGRARQTLTGTGYKAEDNSGYIIKLAHGVNYGVFLELAHEKRFAIIKPTIQAHGPEVLEAFDNLFGKIKTNIHL